MKSPFPGMDPYIEACDLWGDFHNRLIAAICSTLSEALPRGYVARVSKRSYIVLVESEEKAERYFEPDVKVTTAPGHTPAPPRGRQASTTANTLDADSVAVRAFIEEEFAERFIDIYELKPERRLVTSIEVLSPSNKIGGSKGWKQYLRKRQSLLLGKANLVEIDLLRGGTRMPMLDPLPKSPYYLLVAREDWAPNCRVWPAFFDRPLPPIPIPLHKPDPPVPLALQPLLETLYERARYAEDIDYARSLTPPLEPEQVAWLQKRLHPESSAAPSAAPRRRPRRR
ncbi:MAG TPA: DUF4058 family protein [Gemmataceae bacterium]|nr:DUF4058 family protein [Gemmataceae bacterium]